MEDEISVQVSLPLDGDGFLRRQCPTCEQQFKWFSHDEGDSDAELVEQYFCPLCGVPASVDTWWTTEQIAYAEGIAAPHMERLVQDALGEAFKATGLTLKPSGGFTFEAPTPDPIVEPDDMVIVEPPCHPNEPIKVPDDGTDALHCLICGCQFAA